MRLQTNNIAVSDIASVRFGPCKLLMQSFFYYFLQKSHAWQCMLGRGSAVEADEAVWRQVRAAVESEGVLESSGGSRLGL